MEKTDPGRKMKALLHSHFPAGHCYPMQAAAQALVSRGHHVVWLTSADNEARVRLTGAHFVPTTAIAAVDAPLMRRHETGLLDGDWTRHRGRLLAQVNEYRSVLDDFEADVLLVDVLPHGARALFELGEVPVYATLGVIPMYSSAWNAPHAMSGRQPPTTWFGMLVNWLRHVYVRWIVLPWSLRPVLNYQRSVLGLGRLPYGQPLEAFTYSRFLHIQASSPTLEFGMKPAYIEKVSYVGPLVAQLKSPSTQNLPDWWERAVAHPRVIGITQGTLAMDPTSLIVPSIEALSPDPENLLVVVSPHSAELEQRFGQGRHGNVLYADWLPYHLLLPLLRLLITNGGYGSITQALSHKVPLLCAGQTEDKKDTAARVSWAGAGIDLKTDNPSAEQVRTAADRILDDSGSYLENATRLGVELNALGGGETVCDALEDLVRRTRLTKKPLQDIGRW